MSGLDLYQTQRALALLFVYAAALGAVLGGVYDVLRILRVFCGEDLTARKKGSKNPPRALLRFALDLFFCVLCALALVLLCYYANDGQLRAPAVLGMAGGFFVYLQTMGRLTVKLARPITVLLKRVFRAGLRMVIRPIGYLIGWLLILARLLWRGTAGRILRKRREKQTEKAVDAMIASAKQGFGFPYTQAPTSEKK